MYISDLHVHSHYSRGTSKNLNLESLSLWSSIKGVQLIGTGDFTHPKWFNELKEKLEEDNGNGFFKFKKKYSNSTSRIKLNNIRFCISTEISCIYKYRNEVKKCHHLIFSPSFEIATKIINKLNQIGNLKSDGRPILGLSSRNLLEIILESSDKAHLIPAHIWTPWFSILGSKSGYNNIKECFRDLSDHIFALETGLSSDPYMNAKISALDEYTLISNSDAHSPQKIGREANIFDTEFSYDSMFNAIKTKKGFLGTLEFFPAEGKYHLDGHRNCNICLDPIDTLKYDNICPICGKTLTIGVLNRINTLSDRYHNPKSKKLQKFEYIIPLIEIISEIEGKGINTKAVENQYHRIISYFNNEFTFLRQVPIEDINKKLGNIYSMAIMRLRNEEIISIPGYDGLYGKSKLFKKDELDYYKNKLYFVY